MPNYTKLFNSIVTSTIWTEDDKTRIVWITMLALSDQNGEIQASIPGLARLASVSVADVEAALDKLLSPDKYSRTPDNEGRRICPIDGGWELLNHAKYRLMASKEDAKATNAARQKRHRNRNATVTPNNALVTLRNATVTHQRDIVDTDTDTEADTKKEVPLNPQRGNDGKSRSELNSSLKSKAESIYAEYPKKIGRDAAIKSIVKALKYETVESLLDAVTAYAKATEDKDRQYIPNPATWFNQGRYNDDREAWVDRVIAPPQKPAQLASGFKL